MPRKISAPNGPSARSVLHVRASITGHVREQCAFHFLDVERLIDEYDVLHGLGIDIAHVDTAFVVKQHDLAFSIGVDANVHLVRLAMFQVRLDDEMLQFTRGMSDLNEAETSLESTSRLWMRSLPRFLCRAFQQRSLSLLEWSHRP